MIRPTPFTAAIAGTLAAFAWPFANRVFGQSSGIGLELMAAVLLLVALPAHALVVGFTPPPSVPGRRVDRALLTRVGVWLAAALGVTGLQAALG